MSNHASTLHHTWDVSSDLWNAIKDASAQALVADLALPTIAAFHMVHRNLRYSHTLACCIVSMNGLQNMHGITCACPHVV